MVWCVWGRASRISLCHNLYIPTICVKKNDIKYSIFHERTQKTKNQSKTIQLGSHVILIKSDWAVPRVNIVGILLRNSSSSSYRKSHDTIDLNGIFSESFFLWTCIGPWWLSIGEARTLPPWIIQYNVLLLGQRFTGSTDILRGR